MNNEQWTMSNCPRAMTSHLLQLLGIWMHSPCPDHGRGLTLVEPVLIFRPR